MFKEGDIVARIKESSTHENVPSQGVRCVVDCVIDSERMTLKGYGEVIQYQPFYELVERPLRPHNSVHDVRQALHVINNWNRTHPSAGRISIEADEELNGGTLYILGDSYDTHHISEMMDKLRHFVSDADKSEAWKTVRSLLDDKLL